MVSGLWGVQFIDFCTINPLKVLRDGTRIHFKTVIWTKTLVVILALYTKTPILS